MTTVEIKNQALALAKANKQYEPKIQEAYWFPNTEEIRLVELEDNMPKCLSGFLEVFYFGPSPSDGYNVPCGIALIRPDEFKKLTLPDDWGTWDEAEKLEICE